MAILLVFLVDNLRPKHPAPWHAARPGDIITVLEDGMDPGRQIKLPKWGIVYVPGVPVAKCTRFLIPRLADENAVDSEQYAHRLYRLALPPAILAKLQATGTLTVSAIGGDVSPTAALGYILNKATGQTALQEGQTW